MKKGFTLIELLAVIVILAIVALIATPIILDVVEDARKSAAASEANMIVSGINTFCATAEMKAQIDDEYTDICADGVTTSEVPNMVSMGNATLEGNPTYEGGRVTAITVISNNYKVVMTGGTWADPVKSE